MKLSIEITTDNAAFEENGWAEIDSVLAVFRRQLEKGWSEGHLNDSNGNLIGRWSWGE